MRKNFHLKDNFPRLVLIGNSNVGKSTIAKYFLYNKKFATGSVGKHAGSTVSLKQYRDPNLPYDIIDLPGFGAMTRTSKNLKEKIHDEIIQYVERDRDNIFLIMVIINGTRILDELQKYYYENKTTIPLTFEFLTWISEKDLPCILVINKIDKLKKRELRDISQEIQKVLNDFHISIDENRTKGLQKIFEVSAKNQVNMQELKQFIEKQWEFIEH
jgi:GTP-binding protein EngB required for normal cell division